jgi:cbb3-type cytochrome oxidase subunit 1
MSRDEPGPRVETSLVYAHGVAALATLFVSVAFGILASIQLLSPETGAGTPWLSWGRIRYAHTQGIMLGWLGNAFFAFLYHAVPILSGRNVTSATLGRWLFALWNFAVLLPGWILVLAGISQPLEWAEFPIGVDAFVIAGIALAAVQFLPAFFSRRLESLYVSSWYIIGGLVFTLLAYPMGNIVQTVSRALYEEVEFDRSNVTSLDWAGYRIIRFTEAPTVDVITIDRPNERATGSGEPSCNPIAPAIANAVFDAVGIRLRSLPMTPDRVKAALADAATTTTSEGVASA